MYSAPFKSVCYQCSFEGRGEASRCPVCRFPMILEPENTPPGGQRLEDILARASVRDGGPPLPGVDAGKRKAQLLAEARRERRATARAAPGQRRKATTRRELPLRAPTEVELPIRRGIRAIKYGLLCASALAVGVVAAALQSGF
jgi:hypothetical protein